MITTKRGVIGLGLAILVLGCIGQSAFARKVGPEFRVSTTTATSQVPPTQAAVLSNGDFVVAWKEVSFTGQDEPSYRTRAKRFTATGQRTGSEFAVGSFNEFVGGPSAIIPLNSGGGFIIIVRTDEGPQGQRYGGGGAPIGGAFPVSGGRAAGLTNGGFVAVSFDSSTKIVLGQRYTNGGAPVGSAFPVNLGGSAILDVAGLTDGGFVVVWSWAHQDGSGYGIYGRRFNASATPVGGVFRVNNYTDNHQTSPAVAGLANGGFIVTWQSGAQDGSREGVYAQRFNALATRSGGEFRVNTYTASRQLAQHVAGLTDGGFVVVWASYLQDGSAYGVYGKRYNSAGLPASNEFRVSNETEGSQDGGDVAAFANGGFVITWSSSSQNAIFGQRYLPDAP